MGRREGLLISALVLVLFSSGRAARGDEVKFQSKWPLYAYLAVDCDCNCVMRLAFDESQGTGKGYDRLYTDTKESGPFRTDSVVKANPPQRGGDSGPETVRIFPSVPLPGAYVTPGGAPGTLALQFFVYSMRTSKDQSAPPQAGMSCQATVKTTDARGEWTYNLGGQVSLSAQAHGLPVSGLTRTTDLGISFVADQQKAGQIGIAANLTNGNWMLGGVALAGQAIKAHVKIADDQGKVLSEEDIPKDQMGFG
jgi:hypothetical protein